MNNRGTPAAYLALMVGLGAALSLAGCGDRIVARHNWYAMAAVRVTTTPVLPPGAIPSNTIRISGRLQNGPGGTPAPNTYVQETCVNYTKDARPSLYNCQAFLNTGNKAYVAGGMVVNPLKSATLLTDSPDVGRLVLTPLKAPATTVGLTIAALPGAG